MPVLERTLASGSLSLESCGGVSTASQPISDGGPYQVRSGVDSTEFWAHVFNEIEPAILRHSCGFDSCSHHRQEGEDADWCRRSVKKRD